MALNFGSKKVSKKTKSELFPNDAVITMLPLDTEKEGRGAKKFQFNSKAIELMNINHMDKSSGIRSNEEVTFIDENVSGTEKNYFILVNNGPVKCEIDGEIKEFKLASNRVTTGDSSIANTPWYDSLTEYYQLDNTKENYFKIIPVERTDIKVQIYQLTQIHPISEPYEKLAVEKTANQVVNEANKEMEGVNVSIG